MAKQTGRTKESEHEAGAGSPGYKGDEPKIEPPPKKKGENKDM